MTTKTQTMLTIALTAAVSVLMVDRMIEPAQAADCASSMDVKWVEDRARDISAVLEITQIKIDTINMKLDYLVNESKK